MEAHVGLEALPLIGETLDKISKELDRVEWELGGNHAISYVSCGGEVFFGFSFNHMKALNLFLELELKSHIYGRHALSNELP